MREILQRPSHRAAILVVVFAFLSGVLRDMDARGVRDVTARLGIGPALLFGLLICLIMGAIAVGLFYVLAWIATVVGRWLEGTGSVGDVRLALAWGFSPIVIALLYRIPAILWWPDAAAAAGAGQRFLKYGKQAEFTLSAAPPYQVAMLMILHLAVIGWYLVVTSQTLAEAQGFSSWRGLANLLVAFVLPLVALGVIGLAAFLTMR